MNRYYRQSGRKMMRDEIKPIRQMLAGSALMPLRDAAKAMGISNQLAELYEVSALWKIKRAMQEKNL